MQRLIFYPRYGRPIISRKQNPRLGSQALSLKWQCERESSGTARLR